MMESLLLTVGQAHVGSGIGCFSLPHRIKTIEGMLKGTAKAPGRLRPVKK